MMMPSINAMVTGLVGISLSKYGKLPIFKTERISFVVYRCGKLSVQFHV